MRRVRWYHWLTLIGVYLPSAVVAAIFKCKGPDNHWYYSDHRPRGCYGRIFLVSGIAGGGSPDPGRAPYDPRMSLPALRADRQHWARTLRALLATPVPRNRQLEGHRADAIERIQIRLHYDTTQIKILDRRR